MYSNRRRLIVYYEGLATSKLYIVLDDGVTYNTVVCFTDCEVTQRATVLMEHLLECFRYAKDEDNNKNKRL
jgi:hypothetical protein